MVTLPSLHHRWSVTNSTIAQVDTLAGETRGVSLGETAITVEDTRVAGHIQVSTLIVVLPDTISLYISPLSSFGDPVEGLEAIPSIARWYVVSGRQYLIQMKVFTQGPGAHEIYITEVRHAFSGSIYVTSNCISDAWELQLVIFDFEILSSVM